MPRAQRPPRGERIGRLKPLFLGILASLRLSRPWRADILVRSNVRPVPQGGAPRETAGGKQSASARPWERSADWKSAIQQVGNLLPDVAQTSSLPYRGFPIRQRETLGTICRLEVGDTAGWKPALPDVAQTSSLPYRGNKLWVEPFSYDSFAGCRCCLRSRWPGWKRGCDTGWGCEVRQLTKQGFHVFSFCF